MTIAIGFLPLAPPAARQAAGLPPFKACSAYVIVFPCGIFKSSAHIRRWKGVAGSFCKEIGRLNFFRRPLKYSFSCLTAFFIILCLAFGVADFSLRARREAEVNPTPTRCLSSHAISIAPIGDGMIAL